MSFFKREKCVGATRERDGQKKDWHGIVSAERKRIVGRRKKATGETGKAYQTGFQITEVIPSVIDSPIATYRISVGSSWEGNYKGERERRPCERWSERKRDVCGRKRIEKSETPREDNEEGNEKREGAIYYDRSFFHSRISLDDRWD